MILQKRKERKYLENDYMNQFIGKELIFIPEIEKDGYIIGHTGNYLQIKVKGCKDDLNKDIKVVIKENNYPYLKAETKDYNLKI